MKSTLRTSLALAALAFAGFIGGCAANGETCSTEKNGTCCSEGASAGKTCCAEGAKTGETKASAKQPATAK